VDLYFDVPRLVDGTITGKVLFVDTFGNVVTNISQEVIMGLCHYGQTLDVNGVLIPFLRTYSETERRSLLALVGSHGMTEIACSGDSAADMMSLKSGDNISIGLQ
jgi:hypothetical protein